MNPGVGMPGPVLYPTATEPSCESPSTRLRFIPGATPTSQRPGVCAMAAALRASVPHRLVMMRPRMDRSTLAGRQAIYKHSPGSQALLFRAPAVHTRPCSRRLAESYEGRQVANGSADGQSAPQLAPPCYVPCCGVVP